MALQKLLDPAKNLVTSFQLKSAKSSEFCQKNCYFWGWLKSTCKVTYQFFVLHSLSVDKGVKCSPRPPRVSAHNFSVDI